MIMIASLDYMFNQPWKLGFDFDMGRGRVELGKEYVTSVIFSQEELPDEAKNGQGEVMPEAVLLGNGKLEVDAFVDLGGEEVELFVYGSVSMWRLAAIGYGKR